jgi:EAL domain-containing protein (putative c-di-GMP-specific phosphodiesterase class I)
MTGITQATADGDSAAAKRLMRALHEGDLAFAFQPIVAAATREPAYWECLLRVSSAGATPIGGTGMIDACERLGFAPVLDRRTLAMSLELLGRAPAARLSVNLSGVTVANRAWLAVLTNRLRADPGLGQRLVVEITETAALGDIAESSRFVQKLRGLGVRVAVDDFGAGHTSFDTLLALGPDIVKIDRAMASGSAGSPRSRAFVQSLADAARQRGWCVVAEGVEADADEAFLIAEGVGFFQGGRYGRPQTDEPWRERPAG